MFELLVNGQSFPLEVGVPFDFTTVSEDGVGTFTIRGIDVSEQVDPNNQTAFVTGLNFMSGAAGGLPDDSARNFALGFPGGSGS